ncbi:hypothetical protein GCM10025868_26560 [Angustibacter aerolatus]|uniref:EamA domain-containing protein n=1 Tax=Angustibacter aerolatus TaxID=1162965 RepID=A0ABQ6JIN2_9ACTN|nr:EamA family transporter [Angustibacter aerolatus]GMA87406.1 hypothetical protein GCM10025868_26560 [Angustibacter aerolatus]
MLRALPVGLLLLAARRRLPHGEWWWRSTVLGGLNFSVFFVLVFVAAQRLPGGLAATLTATAPFVMMVLARLLVGERPAPLSVGAAVVGVLGVGLLVLRGGAVDPLGVAASAGAVLVSSLGFVLVKRWSPPTDLLTSTSWQPGRRRAAARAARAGRGGPAACAAGTRAAGLRVRRAGEHRAGVRRVVPRPGPPARCRRRPHRPAQPGGRHGARRRRPARAVRAGAGWPAPRWS